MNWIMVAYSAAAVVLTAAGSRLTWLVSAVVIADISRWILSRCQLTYSIYVVDKLAILIPAIVFAAVYCPRWVRPALVVVPVLVCVRPESWQVATTALWALAWVSLVVSYYRSWRSLELATLALWPIVALVVLWSGEWTRTYDIQALALGVTVYAAVHSRS